jgi:uncharacterized protein (DUF2147 family)
VIYAIQIARNLCWRLFMIAFPLEPTFRASQRAKRDTPCRRSRLAALAGVLTLGLPSFALAQDITGTWVTDDGEGAIEIQACGGERCGRIAWMKDPKGPDGRPPTDTNNPDPAMRSRRICGLQIIAGLKPQADGSWGDGRVYNPDNGKTYGMKIRRAGADMVKATGYLGFELFGQTQDWRRAPKNLGSCEDAAKRS